jgi:hypothetical protein
MSSNSVVGYALLAVGVLILLFTFYQAYLIFQSISNGSFSLLTSTQAPATSQPGTNVSIQGVINTAISSAFSSMHFGAYATSLILLVVLALFASIGYKFAKIGINMLSVRASSTDEAPGAKKGK